MGWTVSAIAFRERSKKWELLFEWVENSIEGFASKVSVYRDKCGGSHSKGAGREWVGALGAAARSILTTAWADSVEELNSRKNMTLEMKIIRKRETKTKTNKQTNKQNKKKAHWTAHAHWRGPQQF